MINLFTSYYITDPKRQKELDECLEKNIENKCIDNVYLLIEQHIEINKPKVKAVLIKSRPTFNVFFELINTLTGPEDHNVIANSDIYVDESVCDATQRLPFSVCWALTRYDVNGDSVKFLNRPDSQDTWLIRGHVNNVKADFTMGTPGCDNSLAYLFSRAGYKVQNPSLSIKTYHVHNSGVRSYDPNRKVPEPYLLITPTK